MAQDSTGRTERRQRRSKECAEILNKLCEKHATTIREAHCRLVKSKRTIYILDYGKIDSELCMQKIDKTRKGVFPNGYKVGFEAFGHVWVAVYRFDRAEPSTPRYGFEITPVNDEANEVAQQSSGLCQSATEAFRCAVGKLWGKKVALEDIYRPNGRLYVGIFYEEVQQRITRHFLEVFTQKQHEFYGDAKDHEELITWLSTRHVNSDPKIPAETNRPTNGLHGSVNYDAPAMSNRNLIASSVEGHGQDAGLLFPPVRVDPALASTFQQIIGSTEDSGDSPVDFVSTDYGINHQVLSSSNNAVYDSSAFTLPASPIKRELDGANEEERPQKRLAPSPLNGHAQTGLP